MKQHNFIETVSETDQKESVIDTVQPKEFNLCHVNYFSNETYLESVNAENNHKETLELNHDNSKMKFEADHNEDVQFDD